MNQDYTIYSTKGPVMLTYITKITPKKKKINYKETLLKNLILIHEENAKNKFMDCKMDAKYCHYRKNFIEFHRSKFIESSSLVLEKIYGLVKTHK